MEHLGSETDLPQHGRREDALERKIVNGEYTRSRADHRVVGEVPLLIHRHEPGLPVVGVDDRNACALQTRVLQRGTTEDGETQGVVREVPSAEAVKSVAIEQLRDVNQNGLHAVAECQFDEFDGDRQVAERQRVRDSRGARIIDAAVPGQNDRDVVTKSGERRGQRAEHFGEAARLGERVCFGRNHQDVKTVGTPLDFFFGRLRSTHSWNPRRTFRRLGGCRKSRGCRLL